MSWSYSKISKYKGCPFAWKCQYIDGLWGEPGLAAKRGSDMHEQLELYLPTKDEPPVEEAPSWMIPHCAHLAPYATGRREEKVYLNDKWECNNPLQGKYWVMAVIDLFHQKAKLGTVIDYKSGKRRESHLDQLELYGAMKLCVTPEIDVVEAKAYYLDEKPGGWGNPVFITREALPRIKEMWEGDVKQMEADNTYEPRPNYGCKWCDFASDKGGQCRFSSGGV